MFASVHVVDEFDGDRLENVNNLGALAKLCPIIEVISGRKYEVPCGVDVKSICIFFFLIQYS